MTEETTYTLTPAGIAALEAYTPNCPADVLNAPSEAPAPDSEASASDADTFTPDTPEKVDWVLGKIADARARAARIRENGERIAREADAEAAFMEWKFGAALQAFARQQLAEGGRKKSVRLLNGVLGFRTRPASLLLTDEAEARAWVEANLPSALRVDRRALAERLLQTGEAVAGAQIVPAEEVFYIQ